MTINTFDFTSLSFLHFLSLCFSSSWVSAIRLPYCPSNIRSTSNWALVCYSASTWCVWCAHSTKSYLTLFWLRGTCSTAWTLLSMSFRRMEWVAFPFFRIFLTQDQTPSPACVFCIGRWILNRCCTLHIPKKTLAFDLLQVDNPWTFRISCLMGMLYKSWDIRVIYCPS